MADREEEAEPSGRLSSTKLGVKLVTTVGVICIVGALLVFGGYFYYAMHVGAAVTTATAVYAVSFVFVGVFLAAIGVKLVRAGGLAPSDPLPVVNPLEWRVLAETIKNHQDDPIGQYIRLSSLTGATGWFTKVGISGLPLATISLTMFFAVVAIAVPGPTAAKFIELTQLTLGAFIGSFVQKQVGAFREAVKEATSMSSASGHNVGKEPGAVASSASVPPSPGPVTA